jgi:hypothetical protein
MKGFRLLILVPLVAACTSVPEETSADRQLVEAKCSGCHGLDVALAGERSAKDWAEVLEAMVGHGMVATPEELRRMQAYLASRR